MNSPSLSSIFKEVNGVRLTDETVEKLRKAAPQLRDYFFRNSGCRLLLKEADRVFQYCYVDKSPVSEEELRKNNAFKIKALEKRLRRYGLTSVDSVVVYLPTRGGSGGLSVGGNCLGGNGAANVFVNNGGTCHWFLFGAVHEFHHRLDAIFKKAGLREYPMNHFHANAFQWPYRSQPYPWLFGERFAGDSQILRHWPDAYWAETGDLGTVRALPDKDGDRVPDYWESDGRWGGDPDNADGDGDGLDDLAEAMAGNVQGSSGDDTDSDGDGVHDGRDPYPPYPLDLSVPWVEEGSIEVDGRIEPEEPWHCLISGYEDPALGATEGMNPSVYMAWNEKAIFVAATIEKPCKLTVKLDTAGDSFCAARDNYRIVWNANRMASPEASVYIGSIDALEWTSYGNYDKVDEFPFSRLIDTGDWSADTSIQEGRHVLEAHINANALTGCIPRDGGEVGVRVYFTNIEGESKRAVSVFEHGDFPLVRLQPRSGLFMEGMHFDDGIFGDALPGAGEETGLSLSLRNETGGDLHGVHASLMCAEPRIVIVDGEGAFGSIPDGESVENTQDPFRLRVERGVRLFNLLAGMTPARLRRGCPRVPTEDISCPVRCSSR